MLDTDEITQIVSVLRLDPETSFDAVFTRVEVLAAIDLTRGSDFIKRIQTMLEDITKYEKLIKTGQADGSGNVVSTNVDGEYSVTYGSGGSVASVQQALSQTIAALRALIFPNSRRSPLFGTQSLTHRITS
jgi:hypothetical protein